MREREREEGGGGVRAGMRERENSQNLSTSCSSNLPHPPCDVRLWVAVGDAVQDEWLPGNYNHALQAGGDVWRRERALEDGDWHRVLCDPADAHGEAAIATGGGESRVADLERAGCFEGAGGFVDSHTPTGHQLWRERVRKKGRCGQISV